jgi:wyosine [tRNA(Phe)-imidazoG37] synthetase (radical SAM superfamily)
MKMSEAKSVFGPVPSRRLGLSLGISPLPKKTCNYACVYCQLGRTRRMTNQRQEFLPLETMVAEFRHFLKSRVSFDVVTIVGEGEPTLYLKLGQLISVLQNLTDKPVAVITNGSLLAEEEVRSALKRADLVLPSLDAYDEESFRKINRPLGKIKFKDVYEGLRSFSLNYQGQLWLEMMLVQGLNDDEESLEKLKGLLQGLNYQRLYLNTPVRPPAESWVTQPAAVVVQKATQLLGGMAINSLSAGNFYSEVKDDYEAVLSIIRRHPMNQHELNGFLVSRECPDPESVLTKLEQSKDVEVVSYKGYHIYRLV